MIIGCGGVFVACSWLCLDLDLYSSNVLGEENVFPEQEQGAAMERRGCGCI